MRIIHRIKIGGQMRLGGCKCFYSNASFKTVMMPTPFMEEKQNATGSEFSLAKQPDRYG